MHAVRAATATGRRFRPARGLTAGLVAAFGALIAHALAGGDVALVPGLAVLAVSLPLATVLTRIGRVDVPRLALTAVTAQAVGHLALMMAPGGVHHHGDLHAASGDATVAPTTGLSLSMMLTHLAVVVVTTVVAAGMDQALVAAAWSALAWLLLPALGLFRAPAPTPPSVPGEPAVVPSQTSGTTAAPRGPPRGPLRPHPLLRIAH